MEISIGIKMEEYTEIMVRQKYGVMETNIGIKMEEYTEIIYQQ